MKKPEFYNCSREKALNSVRKNSVVSFDKPYLVPENQITKNLQQPGRLQSLTKAKVLEKKQEFPNT